MLTSVTYRYLKLSVLWLHILFSPVIRVDRELCRLEHFFRLFAQQRSRGRRIRTLARLRAGRHRTVIRLPLGSEQIGNSNQLAYYTVGGLMEGFSLTVKRMCM